MQKVTITENVAIEIINAQQENFKAYINYNSTRQGWFLDLISENFKLYGIRITTNSNILRQWSKRLGFGIYITCENNSEPFFWEDFNTNRAQMFLLDPDDLLVQDILYAEI